MLRYFIHNLKIICEKYLSKSIYFFFAFWVRHIDFVKYLCGSKYSYPHCIQNIIFDVLYLIFDRISNDFAKYMCFKNMIK